MSTAYPPTPALRFNNREPIELPNSFLPRDIDILCGRGRGVWDHTGNRRFNAMIREHAHEYATAKSKMDKGTIVESMVDKMREDGVLFVRKDRKTQRWHEIGEFLAREKTSHAIRDHIYKANCARKRNLELKQTNDRIINAMEVNQYEETRTQQPTVLHLPTTQQIPLTHRRPSSLGLQLSGRPASPRRISDDSVQTLDTIGRLAADIGSMITKNEYCKTSIDIQTVKESVVPSQMSNAIFLDAASSFLERAQTAIAQVEAVIQQELDQVGPTIQTTLKELEQGPGTEKEEKKPSDIDEDDDLHWSELFPITVFDEF